MPAVMFKETEQFSIAQYCIVRTSHGVSRTDSPSTKTLRLAMGLWPRTPLRDATWNNITAHARYLIDTHQIVVDAQGKTVTWRHRNVGKLQTVIHKLEKAFPVLGRAHGHWIALTIYQHHAKVVNEAKRKAKVYRETTTAASSQDDDNSHEHDVAHGVSSARVDNENTRCETPASIFSEDNILQLTSSQHNRQANKIAHVSKKSSKDRSTSSSRKSGRTSKLSRRAQDAEQGSAIMTKAKTAASQAKTAHKSAKKAKKAAARL
ncbi:hypothetical protein BCR37DRAFT_380200 [Protomyces lactucae-debilis]|uniref:Uncharacterized protein n=1 Tax=Protomyces lactucae-debilis TaxID=2754530 RepID=A0A1Y2FBT7_PROLT|nr:uncharacterized protein BCR37DRAFT_380200 [Protomyces lactucae-debilis]ORY81382.1 hypothetical protein BCR37DRAFT_380200 [Protomyces lactucae-debilis]